MKVIFICRLFHPHIGGVERHVLNISKEFKKKNDVTVITEKYDSTHQNIDSFNGVKVIRISVENLNEKQKKWKIWKWVIDNINFLDSFDIIHVHDIVFWLYPYKLLRPFKKIYCTFHGWEGEYPIPIKNILQKKLDSYLVYKNICVGKFIEKWYHIKSNAITYGATKKIYNSRNVIENTLLFVGRLDKDTGIEDCIELFNKNNKLHKLKLEVIGDGPLRKILPSGTIFNGFVHEPENHIRKARYVYTNGYLGIIESLSLGKPVICSYNNPIKADYINLHPMRKYLTISAIPSFTNIDNQAINWAREQSWENLANLYYRLWEIQQA